MDSLGITLPSIIVIVIWCLLFGAVIGYVIGDVFGRH